MNFTNGQELDEILTKLENAVALNIGSQGMRGEAPKRSHWKAKAAIQAHTNAEIAKVLDRAKQRFHEPIEHDGSYISISVIDKTFDELIQAERAKLKEVK
jgi:hypothetical protein